ncbi:MAG: hypothetical protein ACOY3E_10720 [Pseudomonadota bacterium]
MKNYENYVERQLASCTINGLAKALHAIQDSFAGGHSGYKYYDGLKTLTLSHVLQDLAPSDAEQVGIAKFTAMIIKRFQENCSKCTQ